MNDSSAKGKQTKSANAKSAISLQITEPVESKPDGEVISLYAESTMRLSLTCLLLFTLNSACRKLMRIAMQIVEEKWLMGF